ncbi:reverse transcriptase domain, reverse transcriptase zinc-binding domain protein [Tanacetum coccineum]|uniref:Reverse transcriptase domain, reverse transcriptase zinc-binding domain protein n=1 Tax=Tanacetum coccineum TaxID=301880 RepID=A0ABQ5IRA6_9ASTR
MDSTDSEDEVATNHPGDNVNEEQEDDDDVDDDLYDDDSGSDIFFKEIDDEFLSGGGWIKELNEILVNTQPTISEFCDDGVSGQYSKEPYSFRKSNIQHGRWEIPEEVVNVVVIAPQDAIRKCSLWIRLNNLMLSFHATSIVLGDFNELKTKINLLDEKAENVGLDSQERFARLSYMKNIDDLENIIRFDLMQKAKVKWAIEGDENSKFFHGLTTTSGPLAAVEALHVTLQEAKFKNVFEGVKVGCNGVDISHLQFVDDALILEKWSLDNAKNLCLESVDNNTHGLPSSPWKSVIEALEKTKSCKVKDRCCGDGFGMQWEWRRPIRDGEEHIQLIRLVNLLQNYTPYLKHDRWNYLLDPSNEFFVSSMRSHIESVMLSSVHDPVRWNKCLPLKINIHVWRLLLDRLLTRHNLDVRGIDLDSTRCLVCDDNIETTQHLFVECKVAVEIWKMVSIWWDIGDSPKDLQSLITWSDSVKLTSLEKTCFDVAIQTTTWISRRYRNRICFDEKPPSKDSLGAEIKVLSHTWIINRNRNANLIWLDWIYDPKKACKISL